MSLLPRNAKLLEYKIIGHLGSGGFANTYLALDGNLNKQVAIKEFFPRSLCDRGDEFAVRPLPGKERAFTSYRDYFIKEAQTLAKFDEANVVKVLRYFEGLGTAYIIMEFVEGRSLDDLISEHSMVSEETVLHWLTGVLSGLMVLHENGIIHGDIKPANILIRTDNAPVIIDFGASVLYQLPEAERDADDQMVLTRSYAAPEQFSDQGGSDHRIDIFALGAVFYELVTHQKYRSQEDRAPSDILNYGRYYGTKLLRSIAKALEEDPGDRHRTAEEWLSYLTLSRAQKIVRSIRRHKYAYAAMVALVGVTAFSTHYAIENEIDRENFRYKLFASSAEVAEKLRLGKSGAEKIRGAATFFDRYRNEYRSRMSRLDDTAFRFGGISRTTLEGAVRDVDEAIGILNSAEKSVLEARRGYYFDRYPAELSRANGIMADINGRMPAFTRDLFTAVLQDAIRKQAKDRDIPIDEGDLATLIKKVGAAKFSVPVDEVVPQVRPIALEFLDGQVEKQRRKELEALRQTVRAEIEGLVRKYSKWTGVSQLSRHLDKITAAATREELLERRREASAIVKRMVEQREREAERRRQVRLAAKIRSTVRQIEARMLPIEGGTFEMGSYEQGFARPPHRVSIRPFHVAKNEVTEREWSYCVQDGKCRPVNSSRGGDYPVTNVSWSDAQSFVAWLNGKRSAFRYRLPSESEWEFMIRKYGYKIGELRPKIASISVNNANNRGINSLMGNALEWLDDCWHGGYVGAPPDGSSWNRGLRCSRRIVRGSNWNGQYTLTESNAHFFRPDAPEQTFRSDRLGFRLAGDRK